MIRVTDLSIQRGSFRIDHLNLEVHSGEYFCLLGPSGAGKTVIIESIMGLYPLSAGTIIIDDQDVTGLAPEKRQVAYIPQDYGLFPHLSIKENLLFGARARQHAKLQSEERLVEMTQLLEISHLIDRKSIASLSGGERQRVAIARALIMEPGVMFLDEPFAAVDEYLKHQLLEKLLEIKEKLGVTIFHVTHNHHEAFVLGDRIGVLLQGKIQQIDQPEWLYHRPQSIEVANFLLTRNIFEGVAQGVSEDGNIVTVKVGQLSFKGHASRPINPGQAVWAGIRPEEIRIDPLAEGVTTCEGGSCNAMIGKIIRRNKMFASFQIQIQIHDQLPKLLVEVPKTLTCGEHFVVGSSIKVCLNRKALWILPRNSESL